MADKPKNTAPTVEQRVTLKRGEYEDLVDIVKADVLQAALAGNDVYLTPSEWMRNAVVKAIKEAKDDKVKPKVERKAAADGAGEASGEVPG